MNNDRKLKTAVEMLNAIAVCLLYNECIPEHRYVTTSAALSAMYRFADQQTSQMRDENDRLKSILSGYIKIFDRTDSLRESDLYHHMENDCRPLIESLENNCKG